MDVRMPKGLFKRGKGYAVRVAIPSEYQPIIGKKEIVRGHRQQNSLSDAMLRYMACRLWAEFHWQMPNGKRGVTKERNFFVHTWAGYFVLRNSGFSKEKTEQKIIGWKRPWYISDDPKANQPIPIIERVTTKVTLSAFKAGPIVRAIGREVHAAVDHAMGNTWLSDHRLLEKTYEALGLPSNIPKNKRDFT